jgi:hypothetical protein
LAIHAAQLGTEKEFILEAPLFVDATGDGVLVYRSGAEFRWGIEARSEYQEPLAPEKAGEGLMGNTLISLYLRACLFRFLFGSANCRAISCQWSMVLASPTVGRMAA